MRDWYCGIFLGWMACRANINAVRGEWGAVAVDVLFGLAATAYSLRGDR